MSLVITDHAKPNTAAIIATVLEIIRSNLSTSSCTCAWTLHQKSDSSVLLYGTSISGDMTFHDETSPNSTKGNIFCH